MLCSLLAKEIDWMYKCAWIIPIPIVVQQIRWMWRLLVGRALHFYEVHHQCHSFERYERIHVHSIVRMFQSMSANEALHMAYKCWPILTPSCARSHGSIVVSLITSFCDYFHRHCKQFVKIIINIKEFWNLIKLESFSNLHCLAGTFVGLFYAWIETEMKTTVDWGRWWFTKFRRFFIFFSGWVWWVPIANFFLAFSAHIWSNNKIEAYIYKSRDINFRNHVSLFRLRYRLCSLKWCNCNFV